MAKRLIAVAKNVVARPTWATRAAESGVAAATYKVDTDAIGLTAKQEFAATEKAKEAGKPAHPLRQARGSSTYHRPVPQLSVNA
jgi:hypothetical protein